MKETLRSEDKESIYEELIPSDDSELVRTFLETELGYTKSRSEVVSP